MLPIQKLARKSKGFSLLDLLLVITIIFAIVCGISFYAFDFFGFNKQSKQVHKQLPTVINLPKINHNQLVINLNNDPLKVLPPTSNILFAFDNNIKVASDWPTGKAGFLVLSTDGIHVKLLGYRYRKTNGKFAQNGYDALQNLDTNGDKKIDSSDVDYENLYVWLDINKNGKVNSGELKKLQSLGITSIDLEKVVNLQEKVNKSIITKKGQFVKSDGTQGSFVDIDLFQDMYYRQFLNKLPITQDIQALPNATGTGLVRDLQEAATLSPRLASLMTDYLMTDAADRRLLRLDNILFEWAKTADIPSFDKRLQAISTAKFNVKLASDLAVTKYFKECEGTINHDLLCKTLVNESFTGKPLLYFTGQEILNTTTQKWELHLIISFGEQVIGGDIILANQDGSNKEVLLTQNMINFSSSQMAEINDKYSAIKKEMFDRIQAIIHLPSQPSQVQWVDTSLQQQINSGTISQPKRQPYDLPRKRHMSECLKPGNIIDEQVIECAQGKISKTW